MLITIKYFGQIAEVTNKSEEQLEVEVGLIEDLMNILYARYIDLKNKDFKIAQNQEFVDTNALLTGEDIALLPPFSGG